MAEEQVAVPQAPLPALTIDLANDGKAEIRTKVWDYLDQHKLSNFPFPPHKRSPNFKGAEEAGDRVTSLDVFTNARTLKIDADKPLQQVRIRTLESDKTLVVPTPHLRYGFLNKITPPAECDKKVLRVCATRQGFAEYSAPVDLEEKLHVDLVVVGSVAVSTKGWRVGKGEGFSDLEYAIMGSMGSIDSKVPVVAVVHDCQVMDLPDSLFGVHDVPVDYIVTPTRVIKCEGRSGQKPAGVIWSLLSAAKLADIPILRKLRYRDWKAGQDVKIAGETEAPTDLVDEVVKMEDSEERRSKPRYRRNNPNRRRNRRGAARSGGDERDGGAEGDVVKEGSGRRRGGGSESRDGDGDRDGKVNGDRPPRRRYAGRGRGGWGRRGGRRGGRSGNSRSSETERDGEDYRKDGDEDNDHGDSDNKENRSSSGGRGYRGGRRGGGGYRGRSRRPMEDFQGSIYVGSLPRFLRVSDFKGEVRDRKVNPMRVMWRGSSGFAFLNFKTKVEAEEALVALEGLQIEDRSLRLEMAKERDVGGRSSGGGSRRRRERADSRSGGEEDDEGGRDN